MGTTKVGKAPAILGKKFGGEPPRMHLLRAYIVILMMVHCGLAGTRMSVVMTIPAGSNYLVQSQAAREAVCIAWAVAFMAYFGLYGKYQGDMDGKVGKTAHLGTRLMGIGIFLIVFMFLLIGNPLSVLLYNGGKVSNSASLAISGRLLFIASIAVYVYSAATGLFMFVFWAK